MSHIDLYKGQNSLGSFDLPQHVTGKSSIYRLQRAVRKGGNGVVFTASVVNTNRTSGQSFAIKFLRQQDPSRIDRFNNEVRVLGELSSPNIARYFDHGEISVGDYNVPWVAMDLGDCNMREEVQSFGKLDLSRLKTVVPQVCAAIGHLHSRNFIHRDIKPENFVWKDAKKTELLMIDFGIAKRLDEDVSGRPLDNFTKVMEFVGPVFFSSPELIAYSGNKLHPVDFRSDIFQLGKLIWYFATGTISAGVPSKRNCPTGGSLQAIVLEMIQDHPDDRIQSLAEVAKRVDAL